MKIPEKAMKFRKDIIGTILRGRIGSSSLLRRRSVLMRKKTEFIGLYEDIYNVFKLFLIYL